MGTRSAWPRQVPGLMEASYLGTFQSEKKGSLDPSDTACQEAQKD